MSVLVDSYAESNADILNAFTTAISKYGQTFTSIDGILDSCKFRIQKVGSPTGNAVAVLYAHTGTYGTDGTPTGSALATSDVFDVSTLTTSHQLITFNFSGVNRYNIVNATHYCISLEYSLADASNYVAIAADSSSPTASGNSFQYTTGWVSGSGKDFIFFVYASTNYPLTATQASYSLTGEDTLFPIALTTSLVQSSFSLIGENSLFSFGTTLTAIQSSFSLTGENTLFYSSRLMSLVQASFSLTLEDIIFILGKVLSISFGSFILTGLTFNNFVEIDIYYNQRYPLGDRKYSSNGKTFTRTRWIRRITGFGLTND